MSAPDDSLQLNQIDTIWPLIYRANATSTREAALCELVERYGDAVQRYLLGATRDPDVADELFQEFALRLSRGDFRRADPTAGRFRDYVKSTLFNLIVDFQRSRQRRFESLELMPDFIDLGGQDCTADHIFRVNWRHELIALSWLALEQHELQTDRPYYTVLRLAADRPELRSQELAELLGKQLARSVSAEWVRKWLSLAREKFADFLVKEVAHSLGARPSEHELAEELMELGMMAQCRKAWERWAADIWNNP